MVKLSGSISEIIVEEYGQKGFLERLSNPFWFQAFSCVLGFDFHSSGTTTTTCGALKLAIDPLKLGIKVAGGKGKTSRKTLEEIEKTSGIFALSSTKIDRLKYSSMMSAKIDNTCIQDGYQLYHHCFIFSEKGDWVVVQQGMNTRFARRYHWISDKVKSFVEEPHAGICSDRKEMRVLDMTSHESEETRKVSLDLVKDNPIHLEKYFGSGQTLLTDFQGDVEELSLPTRHHILPIDIGKNGMMILKKAYEIQPENYEELVSLKGMGHKKIRALALISELVYGAKPSWKDPAKFSFSHGGKDGIPYPVDKQVYDNSIQTLREAIEEAKLDKNEKMNALKRLRDFLK